MAIQPRKAKTHTIEFGVTFDIPRTLITIGIVLVILKLFGLVTLGWLAVIWPFIATWVWSAVFRAWSTPHRARHAEMLKAQRRIGTGVEAIGWSVAMGLLPGYGHGNRGMSIEDRRTYLATNWAAVMDMVEESSGFLVTAMLSDARVLYPTRLGCPDDGEHVVVLSGSSNPTKVTPEQFDAYVAAVETAIYMLRDVMEQNSVRIEFTRIARSSYHRADGRY